MRTDFKFPIPVDVRDKAGAYVTCTVNGQRASCTSSPKEAMERLAAKLLGRAYTEIVSDKPTGVPGMSRWIIVPDPIKIAWAWASGLIEVGDEMPSGAIPVATGPDGALRAALHVLAREGRGASAGALLVPGVPEAPDGIAAVDALGVWIDWCGRRNGKPDAHGVVFNTKREKVLAP